FVNLSPNNQNNPFVQAVYVAAPDAGQYLIDTRSRSSGATLGAILSLPGDWTAAADYHWSKNQLEYSYYAQDTTTLGVDVSTGIVNPAVDTLLYPMGTQNYLYPLAYQGSSSAYSMAVRGTGPLPALPWGAPSLTISLDHNVGI